VFTLRFDMRAPASGAPIAELYATALDMAEWAERNGCLQLLVSEHHASSDGYLPAPLLLATAFAARTRKTGIQVAALIVPLHDPIELAEQMAVLDVISAGRVSYVCAVGYRPEEYAMFGRKLAGRGERIEACLAALKQAWSGEPFLFEGREVRVTPKPVTPGGPMLLMGGGSRRVIRRAARLGMGMIGQGGGPELEALYREACEEFGTQPGLFINPTPETATSVFVAEDVDRAWEELGPYLLHDARMYGESMAGAISGSGSAATTVEALRAENGNYRIITPDEAIANARAGGLLLLQPLCGGLPAQLAWRHLEVVEKRVLPALASS
jgi:alkanesulfonate monooxygenase SsuD/methylene tetrahydromethanopterin reductase-like flavin-dependent oxidoreductase (luciferase family)